MKKNSITIWPIFLLLVWFATFFYFDIFNPSKSFSLFMDNEFYFGTVFSSFYQSFSNYDLPFRLPYLLDGIPFYNNAQLSPFYPFYFTFVNLYENPYEASINLHRITIFHLLIFYINSYIFLRALGVSKLAAFTGSFLIAFSSNALVYARWVNMTSSYSWFPLFLAGYYQVIEGSRDRMNYIFIIIAGVLITLASPSQSVIHLAFVCLVFFVFKILSLKKSDIINFFLKDLLLLLSLLVFLLLILSPILLPILFDHDKMIRWIGGFPPVIGFSKIPYEAFLVDQLDLNNLAGFLIFSGQNQVGGFFIGPIVLILIFIPFLYKKSNWLIISLYFILFYSFLSSFGSTFGFSKINYNIPLLNMIREPSRFLFLFHLSAGLLVGYGIDEIQKKIVNDGSKNQYLLLFYPSIAVLVLLLVLYNFVEFNPIQLGILKFYIVILIIVNIF